MNGITVCENLSMKFCFSMELSLNYLHQFFPLLQFAAPNFQRLSFSTLLNIQKQAPALFDSFKDVHLLMMILNSLSNFFSDVVLVA